MMGVQKLFMYILLLLLSMIFGIMLPFSAFPSETKLKNDITIKGKVKLSSGEKKNFSTTLDVVLLKFVLNVDGKVTPLGPQARVKTKLDGNFEFAKVKKDLRAGFQLGTRVEGELHSSKIFFMRDGENYIQANIIIPGISNSVEELETMQITIVIESGLGAITITEVLLLRNPIIDKIDTRNRPLIQVLPTGIQNFRMMDTKNVDSSKYKLKSNVLEINNVFPSGTTQIIYQYDLPSWFGGLEISREFDHSLDKVSVFTPIERLQIKSDDFIFSGEKRLNDTTFLSWKSKESDSNRLIMSVSNVTRTSLQYAIVSLIIILLLFAAVLFFYRTRLSKKKNLI